ncbi:DUF3853 family protein [Elizabethkingia anophelis]|uniref:DUF3853 family protein n=1 Tax=Elizabethkingia anophelis TaxID=1117645 RepID=UPI0021A696DA|nr:DUF3853 family protein [Elizabethkingia anophelis]MCT4263279.1 DUF3853 family protein [Elizabethkingia anophelis]MDV3719747.1 hypothetical protein [Elizabethkingia anophelis]MDV3789366.1 hypothetical protein [Elizabethkingia anophelis]
MKVIDPKTPLWQLTVEEFLDLQKFNYSEKKYEYGIKGLAKILGCSRTKAAEIKASGILNEAIVQNGNIIVIDKEKAIQLFGKK